MSGSHQSLLSDRVFNLLCLTEQVSNLGAVLGINPLFALGTIQKVEDNTWCCPLLFQDLLHAVEVEDVLTAELDARLRPEPTSPTDRAVSVLICIRVD